MAMSLTQLAILIKVVDAGSFSAAAKSLYLSQPAVSNQGRARRRTAPSALFFSARTTRSPMRSAGSS